jgi:hypothetical protein
MHDFFPKSCIMHDFPDSGLKKKKKNKKKTSNIKKKKEGPERVSFHFLFILDEINYSVSEKIRNAPTTSSVFKF